jgi:hypothetical protein
LVALSFGAWIMLRVPYHEWRLRVAIADYERVRDSGYSLTEDVWGLIRGEPLTSKDYEERAREHQEKLVDLKYYERREIPLAHAVTDIARQDELAELAMKRIHRDATWAFTFSTGATSLIVTDRPARFGRWQQVVHDFERPRGTNQTAGEPKGKPAC